MTAAAGAWAVVLAGLLVVAAACQPLAQPTPTPSAAAIVTPVPPTDPVTPRPTPTAAATSEPSASAAPSASASSEPWPFATPTPGPSVAPSVSAGPSSTPVASPTASLVPPAPPSLPPTPPPSVPSESPTPAFTLPPAPAWPAAVPGAPARVVSRGPDDKRVVALTIDDGNDAAACRRVFEILREHRVPATFFPIAARVRGSPSLWREIAGAGYPIGNHTVTHRNLATSDERTIRNQLVIAERDIEAITGHPMIPVLRPTYGAYDERVLRIAGQHGIHTVLLWGTSAADTGDAHPDRMVERATSAGRGAVVLMHCNYPVSAEILPRIIAGYQERGFRFVTVQELFQGPP